jgi:acyl-coenzyme A thioesterase PaaI-like protein
VSDHPWSDIGWEVGDEEGTEQLAEATRRLIAAVRRVDAPSDVLDRTRRLVDEATALLAPHVLTKTPMQGRRGDRGPGGGGAVVQPREFFPWSPILGPLNPISPPIEIEFDGDRIHGTMDLGAPWNGPPGMVHGGIIALVFDEILGACNVCHGVGAFTGTLSVRYEKPTFVDTPHELEAWLDRVEGRKVFTKGEIRRDGEVTARAEGVFIRTPEWSPRD